MGGKSFILALIAVFLACFRDWRPFLNVGERGTIMVIAQDRRQARVIMRYVKGMLRTVPMLKPIIEAERQEAVDLNKPYHHRGSHRFIPTVRGYTIVAALLDEWRCGTVRIPLIPTWSLFLARRTARSGLGGVHLRQVWAVPSRHFVIHLHGHAKSSFIRRVCYDAPKSYGHQAERDEVPLLRDRRATVQRLLSAGSAVKFYNENIRSRPDGSHGPFDCCDHILPNYP